MSRWYCETCGAQNELDTSHGDPWRASGDAQRIHDNMVAGACTSRRVYPVQNNETNLPPPALPDLPLQAAALRLA